MSFPNSRQLVLNLANTDNPPPPGIPSPTFQDVALDPIVLLPEDHSSNREVSVLVRSLPTGRFRNNRIVYYTRYDLEQFFGPFNSIPYTVGADYNTIIDTINSRYGLSLEYDEFTITEFEDETYDGTVVTLVANADNFAYRGQKQFQVINEDLIPLETVIVNQILNGLVYPDISELQSVVIEDDTISGNMVLPGGALLGGSTHSADGFTIAGNGEVVVAISANRVNSPMVYDTVDGVKTIPLPLTTSDWNFIYSVGLVGDLSGARITQHYDVTLSVTNNATHESLNMQLIDSVVNPGNIDWRIMFDGQAHQNGNDITDNATTESFDTVLNIQRVSFYREAVMPETDYIDLPPRAALGEFTIVMTAQRKNSIGQPVVATLGVVVTPPV